MKFRTKKIIAREFIFLLVVIATGLLFFLGAFATSEYARRKNDRLTRQLYYDNQLADSLSYIYNERSHYWNNGDNLPPRREPLHLLKLKDELRKILADILIEKKREGFTHSQMQQIADSFKWANMDTPLKKISPIIFALLIKDKFPEYKMVQDSLLAKQMLEKYPEYGRIVNAEIEKPNIKDSSDYRQAQELRIEVKELETKRSDYEGRILSGSEEVQLSFVWGFGLAFFVLFFVRYFYYSLRWSIRILRQKE